MTMRDCLKLDRKRTFKTNLFIQGCHLMVLDVSLNSKETDEFSVQNGTKVKFRNIAHVCE